MILEHGEKIHVITRRFYDEEPRRHFVGEVIKVEGSTARVEGFAYVFNASRNEFSRRPERRVRLMSLVDAGNVINVLPRDAVLDKIVYRVENKRLVLTDDHSFRLDVNEFGG